MQTRGRGWRQFARRHKINSGLLFVLPALALYLLYVAWPIASMLITSLYQWDGVSPTRIFVGLQNYVTLIANDPVFHSSIIHNIIWAAITLPAFVGFGFGLAYMLDQPLRFRAVYRTAVFLPVAASTVVTGFVWQYIYQTPGGPLNSSLQALGLDSLTKVWLADPQVTLFAVIAAAIWAYLGFYVIVQMAAIQSIPRDLFDSASLDGATGLQKIRYIAAPLTSATTRSLIILVLIGAINEFGLVFVLSRGGPYHASEVVALQIYTQAFTTNHLGYASALSALLLVAAAAITIVQLRGIRRREGRRPTDGPA